MIKLLLKLFCKKSKPTAQATPQVVPQVTPQPRGIRNNNPGNIRWSSSAWQGLDKDGKSKDASFCVFVSPEYGIRALAKLLFNYYNKYNLKTIRQIINRYAPTNENNTSAYVKHVCDKVGVLPDDKIQLSDFKKLIEGIILHENGIQPYSDEVIKKGLSLAKILDS